MIRLEGLLEIRDVFGIKLEDESGSVYLYYQFTRTHWSTSEVWSVSLEQKVSSCLGFVNHL